MSKQEKKNDDILLLVLGTKTESGAFRKVTGPSNRNLHPQIETDTLLQEALHVTLYGRGKGCNPAADRQRKEGYKRS